MIRCTLLVAAILLSAGAAVAQISEKEASKQLKSGVTAEMKGDLARIKDAQKEFLGALKDFQSVVKGGGYSFNLLQDLFLDYQDFAAAVTGIVRSSGNDASLVATPILTSFANGAALMGQFPKDFYYGTGGPMDTMLDRVFAAQHKAIATVSKKLKSTRTVLEKSANVALTTVQRGTPAQPNAIWFDESGGSWSGSDGAMTLDTAWGVSDMSVLGDGTLLVSGSFRSSTGDVDVSINGPEFHTFTGTDSGTLYMNRWVAIFDNGGIGLAEGNYGVAAQKPAGGPKISVAIGIR